MRSILAPRRLLNGPSGGLSLVYVGSASTPASNTGDEGGPHPGPVGGRSQAEVPWVNVKDPRKPKSSSLIHPLAILHRLSRPGVILRYTQLLQHSMAVWVDGTASRSSPVPAQLTSYVGGRRSGLVEGLLKWDDRDGAPPCGEWGGAAPSVYRLGAQAQLLSDAHVADEHGSHFTNPTPAPLTLRLTVDHQFPRS
jgi:hypothetical protein